MKKWMAHGWLGLILLIAAVLRLTGVDWDNYYHFHPDERYIAWVATTIEWPADWRTALLPNRSTFNPYYWPPEAASAGIEVLQDQPRRFAYGHFPLYLGVAATRLSERVGPGLTPLLPDHWLFTRDVLNGAGHIEFRHLTAVARALTALVDVCTVWLTFLLGRRVYGTAVGLLAAAFLAFNVMHVQLAHFFTSDPYLTFFVTATIYGLVAALDAGNGETRRFNPAYWLLAAVGVGLAVGSKFAAILLCLPLALTAWMGAGRRWPRWLAAGAGVAVLAFALTNPFAVLDFSCQAVTPAIQLGPLAAPAINWGSCFLENVVTQGAMARGELDLAFTRQYAGTLPFLYYIEMQLRWGMGPLLAALAFAGLGWATWSEFVKMKARGFKVNALRSPEPQNLIILAWCIPFLLTTGSFYVKFMRYLQPLVPFLMVYGAAMLWQWRSVWGKRVVGTAVLLTTALYALSFVNIYRQPHPWVSASAWIYAHAPPGALILSEQWDDPLPTTMRMDDQWRRREEYAHAELTWLTNTGARDDEAKLWANLTLLAQAEYVTIVSNRVYGVAPRLPERYPISGQYHQLLFDGALGYEPLFVAGRWPNLAGVQLRADTFGWPGLRPPALVADYLSAQPGVNWGRADESFLVYDQPLTIIFQNTGQKTADEMRVLFQLE